MQKCTAHAGFKSVQRKESQPQKDQVCPCSAASDRTRASPTLRQRCAGTRTERLSRTATQNRSLGEESDGRRLVLTTRSQMVPTRTIRPEEPDSFKAELLELVPYLRAFARSLSRRHEGADDLAQEALVKAWQSRDSFVPGTNLKAWLFTILRNQFYSERRRAWRQVPWDAENADAMPGN